MGAMRQFRCDFVRQTLRVPGLPHDIATTLAHTADQICPYSKATRGNIDVALNVLTV